MPPKVQNRGGLSSAVLSLCPRVAFVPRTLCAVNIFRVFFIDLLMMRL